PGSPKALRFDFPLLRDGGYRVHFTATDGDKNADPQRYRVTLLDSKPSLERFDVAYDYPKYLRWKPQTVVDARTADAEAIRGTQVTITAGANRPVRDGRLLLPGAEEPVKGELVEGQVNALRFALPPLDRERTFRLAFAPATDERPPAEQAYRARVIEDAK